MSGTIELMDVKECAELLKVKVSWLRKKVFLREIPFTKLGALVRFDKAEIIEWVKEQSNKAA